MYPLVPQEDLMGCGIACVASILGISYAKSKSLFDRHDGTRPDCYCPDIVRALERGGTGYNWREIRNGERVDYVPGSIVFVAASKHLPVGHFLVCTGSGWMDSWINLDISAPDIKGAKAGYRKCLPGRATYYIHPK